MIPRTAVFFTLIVLNALIANLPIHADEVESKQPKQYEETVALVRESIIEDLRNRRFDRLLPLLRAAVKDHPENAEVHYKLASVLYLAGDTQEAVSESEKAVRLNGKVGHYHVLYGRALLVNGNVDTGIDELNKAIQIDNQSDGAYCALGEVYLDQLKYLESIENFSSALAIREFVRARVGRAAAEYRSGKHAEAIADCDAILLKEPNNHEALAFRAFAKLFIEDSVGIKEDAEKALKSGEKYASLAHYALGSVCSLDRDYVAAIEHMDKCIYLAPAEPMFYYARGRIHLRNQNFDHGIEDLEMSTQVAGSDERLNQILGDKAWEVYKCRAGAKQLFKKDYAGAIKDADRAIQLNANDADCYLIRAWAKTQPEDQISRMNDLDKAVSLAPNNTLALSLLAESLATSDDEKVRDSHRAKELATKACALTQYKNPKCLSALAVACADIGEFKDACTWQSQVVDQLTNGKPTELAVFHVDWGYPLSLACNESDLNTSRDRLERYRKGWPLAPKRNAMRPVDDLLDIVPR